MKERQPKISSVEKGELEGSSWEKVDWDNFEELDVFMGHDGQVLSISKLPDGRIISGGADGVILVWNPAFPKEHTLLKSLGGEVMVLDVLPDGAIISGNADGTIQVLNKNLEEGLIISGHIGGVLALAGLPDGRIVSGGADGAISLWDWAGNKIKSIEPEFGPVNTIAKNPAGGFFSGYSLRSGHQPFGKILGWDNNAELKSKFSLNFGVDVLSVSPDGQKIACGCEDGTILLLNSQTGEILTKIKGLADDPRLKNFNPEGENDERAGNIKMFNPLTGKELFSLDELESHLGRVTAIDFLPDGTILSASEDTTIRRWDPKTGEQLKCLRSHAAPISGLVQTPEGHLFSASQDGTIRLWGERQ